jgi:hypothetical protein
MSQRYRVSVPEWAAANTGVLLILSAPFRISPPAVRLHANRKYGKFEITTGPLGRISINPEYIGN